MKMPKLEHPILLAVVGAPHGVKGELRVKTFTGDPLALADYGPLHSADGRRFDVEAIRPANTVMVVRFKQVRDRSAAEALNGTELYVERSALPDPGEDDQFYHADLIGMTVLEAGEPVGKVTAVQDFGGGAILEISHQARKGVMVPFTKAAVPKIDLSSGMITVDPVAAGLVDEPDAGPAHGESPKDAAVGAAQRAPTGNVGDEQ